MDGYRQTLLGRALADTLRDLEAAGGDGGAIAADGDALFSLFDEAVREELAAALRASGRRGSARETASEDEQAARAAFTHRSLALDARLRAFNRFEDKWSLRAEVTNGGLALDGSPLRWGGGRAVAAAVAAAADEAAPAALPMLVKLQQIEGGAASKT